MAPTARASIKSALTALLNKLLFDSKIGHWLQLARVRIAAILISVVTLLQPPTVPTVNTGGGQSGGTSTVPVMGRTDASPRTPPEMAPGAWQAGSNHWVPLSGWAPSLSPIAEQPHMAMPVVGRVSEVPVVLSLSLPADCALCDDGATVDCSKTAMGRIPGTFTKSDSELSIGESTATLASLGMWYHAFTRIGADGTEEDGLFHMMDTPTGIATIFSEVMEVKLRRTTIIWSPDAPRVYTTAKGNTLPLIMTDNGLGLSLIHI